MRKSFKKHDQKEDWLTRKNHETSKAIGETIPRKKKLSPKSPLFIHKVIKYRPSELIETRTCLWHDRSRPPPKIPAHRP